MSDPKQPHLQRQSRYDLDKCAKDVLDVLKQFPLRYVTAGWLEDRGVGFNEHTIGIVLRKLHSEFVVDYVPAHGFQMYAYRTDVRELVQKRAERKKNKTPGSDFDDDDGGSDD